MYVTTMCPTDDPRDESTEERGGGAAQLSVTRVENTADETMLVGVRGEAVDYTVAFDRSPDGALELVSGERMDSPSDEGGLQRATIAAVTHLRAELECEIRLSKSPTDERGPLDVREDAYFVGGCGTRHLYAGTSPDSLCSSAVMTGARERLSEVEGPVSGVDGVCQRCLRQLKIEGHYETYENPNHY